MLLTQPPHRFVLGFAVGAGNVERGFERPLQRLALGLQGGNLLRQIARLALAAQGSVDADAGFLFAPLGHDTCTECFLQVQRPHLGQ